MGLTENLLNLGYFSTRSHEVPKYILKKIILNLKLNKKQKENLLVISCLNFWFPWS